MPDFLTGIIPTPIRVASSIENFTLQFLNEPPPFHYPIALNYGTFISLYWKLKEFRFEFSGYDQWGYISQETNQCEITHGWAESEVIGNFDWMGPAPYSIASLQQRACLEDELRTLIPVASPYRIEFMRNSQPPYYLYNNPTLNDSIDPVVAVPMGDNPLLLNNPTYYTYYPYFKIDMIGGYTRWGNFGMGGALGQTGVDIHVISKNTLGINKVGTVNLNLSSMSFLDWCQREFYFDIGKFYFILGSKDD